jgi:hypothetical protein
MIHPHLHTCAKHACSTIQYLCSTPNPINHAPNDTSLLESKKNKVLFISTTWATNTLFLHFGTSSYT